MQLFPESMGIHHEILLSDGKKMVSLPDWAQALIWLGWWSRQNQLEHFRMLVVAVLPSRELAAAFASLGCLFAGGQLFRGGFTWDELRNLPLGSEIFWKDTAGKRNGGIIIEGNNCSSDIVWIRPKVGPKRCLAVWGISKGKFCEHLFCEDKLPPPRGTEAMEKTLRLCSDLGFQPNPRWIVTAGAEARVVTIKTRFWGSIENLQLCAQESSLAFSDALCALRGSDDALAKLHITSINKVSDQSFPVSILDGASAFCQVREINSGNILIFLDRTEYSSEIHNFLLEASNVASKPPAGILWEIPSPLPSSMEITAFVLPKDA